MQQTLTWLAGASTYAGCTSATDYTSATDEDRWPIIPVVHGFYWIFHSSSRGMNEAGGGCGGRCEAEAEKHFSGAENISMALENVRMCRKRGA